MATGSKMEMNFVEKMGDGFTRFTEGLVGFLTRLFGSSNERHIRALGYIRPKYSEEHTIIPGSLLHKVNALEEQMLALTDEELKGLTPKFRERLANGEALEDLMPDAFAACRESARRFKNMRHFDVQILGGAVLHKGNIAEMVTGEGKTLVATLAAYLNALEQKGVHIVTVNDYLARRDCEWMSPIYHGVGITAGYIQSDMDPVARRKAYDCDITYGTNSEYGFDYLRDNMKPARWADPNYPSEVQQCQKALNYAIVDEVDNILIDEARTPLIISGPAFGDLRKYIRANDIVIQLNELQKQSPGKYFEVKEKEHTCHLTDDGVRKAEELAGVESFYTAGNMEWPHLIDNALKAHHLYHKDKQYVVMKHPETQDMSVIIVDEFTGRLMIGRQWSDGLHQAVEAKHAREGVKIKEETQTLATVTLQNFFRLYKKCAGMTGTAMTEANEFWKIYKLDVIAIPTNKPLVRVDFADQIYLTEKEKWAAIVDEIDRINKWDVVKLNDGTEVIGTVKKEDQWTQLMLKDGNQLVGKIKKEHEWTVLKLTDGTSVNGTVESEDEWMDFKLTDGSTVQGTIAEERDNEVDITLRGSGDKRTLPTEQIEEAEETGAVVFAVRGGDEKRTIPLDQIEDRGEGGEIDFVEKESGEKRTIALEDIESYDDAGAEIEIVAKGSNEKKSLAAEEIDSYEPRGRPILVGTTTVEKSEKLASLLKKRGVKVELLNAKPEYAAREAEIIAQAGRIGAVTISTNMAGRGTDIILGGNAEFLAWARLKEKYATRLDVPPSVWKQTVDEIEAKEKLKEEGRRVAAMGGLHVLGTERHEARRIDNQLRGRSGRQGDPGSSRFFLSLEDDLMRIFAGEWVGNFLRSVGMEEGQAIESRMVSRRIETAQKKVEERNFDIRRNLLEFDEVMDHQRKSVYGYRQDILENKNCKLLILRMMEQQIDDHIQEFLDRDYGLASFAEFVSKRLSHEFQPAEFARMDFDQAERFARERASKQIEVQVHDILEENLSNDVEQKEWNWQAAVKQINNRWGIKMTERDMKKIGRENLAQHLIIEANKVIEQIDLSGGRHFLDPKWGLKSACDWVRLKFQINLQADELSDKTPEEIASIVYSQVKQLYHDKDVEFPVRLGMARFMSERHQAMAPSAHKYDRDGLLHWAKERFPNVHETISEEEFRTESRTKLQEKLNEVSRKAFPKLTQTELDGNLQEAFEGEEALSEETAAQFAGWLKTEVDLDIKAEDLTGAGIDDARQIVWNAYDLKYRPEMRRMERNLLLQHLDTSWKNHLYTMDHLRQGIGLVGYAQEDPKTAYKRDGMKEFEGMWRGVRDKVSDTIFRMEEAEGFEESVWSISEARHDQTTAMQAPPEGSIQAQQMAAIQTSQQTDKKPEPIRNRGQRVGRNEPCPCGSGKKYKNCCMKTMAG